MAGNPHPVFQDGVPVHKGNARTYLPLRLGNPDALRGLNGSTFWLCYIQTTLAFFYRDTSDTTSEDNGTSVIKDADGNIWKVISSGAGIAINAAGPLADRGDFNGEDSGFTYFGTDTELLYIRLTGGGWSSGSTIAGPRGEQGEQGEQGEDGPAGPANALSIGSVTSGPSASAEITGASPSQVLNLVLPNGADGVDGTDGSNGADGGDGWSPLFSIETDSARRVLRVVDWVGGESSKPPTGKYVGSSGLETNIGDGVDIRGPQGAAGAGSGDMEKSVYDPDDDGRLDNAVLADMAQGTVKMRRVGAGTGAPTDTTLMNLKGDLALDNLTNVAQLPLSYLDTDVSLASNSDTKVPSQKAVKAYADALIAANDAMVFKGVVDCSANPNYPAADRGWTYRVSIAGKIGGGSGVVVQVGDILICLSDGTSSGNQATVGANWTVVQANIDGALVTTDIGVTVQAYDANTTKNAASATLTNKTISTKDNAITGVQDDSNAAAGQVGEYVVAKNTSGVSLASGVTQNILSLTLGPGDWDVRTSIRYFSSGGATITNQHTIIADQSATIPDYDHGIDVSCNPNVAGDVGGFMCGPYRYNVATGQTKVVYGIARCTYASGSITVKGIIEARRVR